MKKLIFTLFLIFLSFIAYSQDTINVPGDFTTIQTAINAAVNGDLVLVDDGTYTENINFRGKAITVASNFIVNGDTSHRNNTIIDGSQPSHPDSGSVVTFNSGEDTNSVLCGFTITGGTGTFRPANPPSYPVPFRYGGGILCSMSGACIKNNIIKNNECIINLTDAIPAGGGICSEPPGNSSFVVIDSNQIVNNSVWAQGNITLGQGYWAQGGGVALYTDGLVTNNEILSNQCKSIYGYGVGGGIRLLGGTTKIFNNYIDLNSSISVNSSGIAGGISCSWANTVIDSNNITNNFIAGASECSGAGIYFDLNNNANWAVVKNNYISGNYYTNGNCTGGAIGMKWSSPDIYNNVITNNSADKGGALHTWANSKPIIINNTITNNTATQEGGALYFEDPSTNPIIINSILWNNGSEIYPSNSIDVLVYYSDIDGVWTGTGSNNIDVNPFFADQAFNLADTSLCIGAGIDSIKISGIWYYAPSFDIDGDPRPNPPECMPDIGAQESSRCGPATTIIIHPTILDFGEVKIDSSSTLTFTITNTGNTDLVITDISSNEPAFIVNINDTTILPGNDQDVEVTFTPTEEKQYDGLIEITHNAVGSPDSISVIGNGIPTGIEDGLFYSIPSEFVIYQNYPNPFNPMTSIIFGLPEASEVKLTLFNSLGEKVTILFEGYKNAGYHQMEFEASRLPSGVYFYQLRSGFFVETKKMILMK